MGKTKTYDVTVESGILAIFQQQSYKIERVFSEFIDNSLQNYLDHRDKINQFPDGEKCVVDITWNNDYISIKDNAFGMDDEEFARALKLKAYNPRAGEANRLSVYGMGLKYAAVYLGNNYSINSKCYGEGIGRYAVIDVPTFEKTNPKEIPANIFEKLDEERGTEIKITNLRIHKTAGKVMDLIEKLGIIYHHYIDNGVLLLNVNKLRVEYKKPEFRKKDGGGTYFEKFDSYFTYGGVRYNFSGFIGILAKGNQSITGLSLVQANRCIQLNWKPEKLFGKGNSFPSSRVVGEVVFEGGQNILSYDKDQFVWSDNGTEEAFIKKLGEIPDVYEIFKQCKLLKKTCNVEEITHNTLNIINNSNKASNSISSKKENNSENILTDSKSTNISQIDQNHSVALQEKKKKEIVIQECDDESKEYEIVEIEVKGKKVRLYICLFEGFAEDEWLHFDKYNDGYLLKVNYKNQYILSLFSTKKALVSSNYLAIILAKSMIEAQDSGVKLSDSLLIFNLINKFNNGVAK